MRRPLLPLLLPRLPGFPGLFTRLSPGAVGLSPAFSPDLSPIGLLRPFWTVLNGAFRATNGHLVKNLSMALGTKSSYPADLRAVPKAAALVHMPSTRFDPVLYSLQLIDSSMKKPLVP